MLDAVQDPGNVGTILRTAAALGAAAVVAMPGTVDLWNAKVVRSAMGALFHGPVHMSTWAELDTFRARHWWTLGRRRRTARRSSAWAPRRLALLVGNEGAGLSQRRAARASGSRSRSPSRSAVESLNVAVATGIILYQLRS